MCIFFIIYKLSGVSRKTETTDCVTVLQHRLIAAAEAVDVSDADLTLAVDRLEEIVNRSTDAGKQLFAGLSFDRTHALIMQLSWRLMSSSNAHCRLRLMRPSVCSRVSIMIR